MLMAKIIEDFQHLSCTHSHVLPFFLSFTLYGFMDADYYLFPTIICDDRSSTGALLSRALIAQIIFAVLLNIS